MIGDTNQLPPPQDWILGGPQVQAFVCVSLSQYAVVNTPRYEAGSVEFHSWPGFRKQCQDERLLPGFAYPTLHLHSPPRPPSSDRLWEVIFLRWKAADVKSQSRKWMIGHLMEVGENRGERILLAIRTARQVWRDLSLMPKGNRVSGDEWLVGVHTADPWEPSQDRTLDFRECSFSLLRYLVTRGVRFSNIEGNREADFWEALLWKLPQTITVKIPVCTRVFSEILFIFLKH